MKVMKLFCHRLRPDHPARTIMHKCVCLVWEASEAALAAVLEAGTADSPEAETIEVAELHREEIHNGAIRKSFQEVRYDSNMQYVQDV